MIWVSPPPRVNLPYKLATSIRGHLHYLPGEGWGKLCATARSAGNIWMIILKRWEEIIFLLLFNFQWSFFCLFNKQSLYWWITGKSTHMNDITCSYIMLMAWMSSKCFVCQLVKNNVNNDNNTWGSNVTWQTLLSWPQRLKTVSCMLVCFG